MDLLEGDVELTEFEEIDVQSVKGVAQGANGFPILLMKGIAEPAEPAAARGPCRVCGSPDCGIVCERESAEKSEPEWFAALTKAVTDGKVDEAPDIATGSQVMALLSQAIASEASEIGAGSYGETRDVAMLVRAADLVSTWISREQAVADGKDPDAPCGCCTYCSGMGCGCCGDCGWGAAMCSVAEIDGELAKALLSGKERNNLPDSAFAFIEDGGKKDADGKTTPRRLRHFAIHDKAHADNAAARIAQGAEFGDKAKARVRAAQRKFGESDGADEATKSADVAEDATTVDNETQDDGLIKSESLIKEAVSEAVTKATAPLKERIESLGAELAKVKATPVPGGPVLSVTRTRRDAAGEDFAAKAAYFRQKADQVSDQQMRDGYLQLAREADDKAKGAPAS